MPYPCSLHSRPRLTALALVFHLLCLQVGAANAVNDSTVNALKQLSLDELANLEVTSVSRRVEKLSEVASAIQVITGEDIRRSGATSIPEALRLATNLTVAQIDSRQWAISARGFNNSSANKLLVLMDGRTLYSPLHAAVFWDAQDTLLDDLDRIEVISGPGATQWGANAVNGVINITTKGAKETQGLLITGGGGSQLDGFAGARYGGTVAPGVHYRIYGKSFSRDATRFADGREGANDWSMNQGGFRIDWDGSDDKLLTLQGDLYSGSIGQPTNGDVKVSGNNLLLRWSGTLSANSSLTVQSYFDHTHRLIPGTFSEDLDIYDVDLQYRVDLGEKHKANLGIGFRSFEDREQNISPLLAFIPDHVIRRQFSFSAQDEIALVPDQLQLTVGTKVEHNYYTGYEFQPSVRASWFASENQTGWAAVSRAVRAPSRIDSELVSPRDPPFTLLAPSPDFESEILLAYELGWRTQPRDDLALTISSYYSDYDKLRTAERTNAPSPYPITAGNKQEGTVTGVEVTADHQVSEGWRLRAGYNWMNLDLRNKPESTAPAPSHTDPEHQFFLRSSLDLSKTVQIDASYRFIARLPAVSLPAYDELDIRLGWKPTTAVELSLVGQNLLHAQHAEFNPVSSRETVARNIYAMITWNH